MTWGKIELLGDVQVQCLCPEHVLARLAETRCKTPIYLLTHLAELLKVFLCIFEVTVCYTVLGHLLRVNFEAPFSALFMSDGTRRIVGCCWVVFLCVCVCMCAGVLSIMLHYCQDCTQHTLLCYKPAFHFWLLGKRYLKF